MTKERQDALLAMLVRDGGWVTASAIGDRLGVSTRSIRSYVTALNARVDGQEAIVSGPAGYRARAAVVAAVRAGGGAVQTPRTRQRTFTRDLLLADDGLDLHDWATAQFVSSATAEADLARVRQLLADDGLVLDRAGSTLIVGGPESARRRAIGRMTQDEATAGYDVDALRQTIGPRAVEALAEVRRDLGAALAVGGNFVNEFALAAAAVSIAIAAQRVATGHLIDQADASVPSGSVVASVADTIGELSVRALGVELPEHERISLAEILVSRGTVAPSARGDGGFTRDDEVEAAVREALAAASAEFGVPELEAESVARLALHVQNLRLRGDRGDWSRNPLTRSLKSAYPLLFDVAVRVAADLQDRLGIPVRDDEIAYFAMHIGGQWERTRARANRLTATLVCPGYYELHELLRASVERSLESTLTVTAVRTESEPDWSQIDTDLVLSTIDPPSPADHIVHIPPFLTDIDVERVLAAASRVRRGHRLAQLRTELRRYFVPTAFARGISGSEESVIRQLGALLVEAGAIDEAYVDSAVERERMSSTAFTDILAVPHALGMTASRTAIAVGIADPSIAWGEERVQVVALVAFSDADRDAFQTVFEQFVEVFCEPAAAQRLVRRGVDFPGFLHELAAVIDG